MKQFLRKVALTSTAIFIAVASVNIGGVAQVMTANAAPGNNGTLKVHEFGTPANSESNDPKVCVFNFEAFGLDANQTGNVTIEAQNPTAPITPVVIPLATDASGNGQTTPYVNAANSPYILQSGHYKATLDNKFGTDPGDKAKSKVFKVECAAPVLTNVTPAAPTKVDLCGTLNDTYTIPSTTGVSYQINGQTVAANTYSGTGTVVITAVANTGYALSGTTSWTFTFATTPCNVTVTPATPTKADLCGTANDTYIIPSTVGVIYKVNGVEKQAGIYQTNNNVLITASPAAPHYILQGTKVWAFIYTNLPCVVVATPPTESDVCGRDNDTYTIPTTTGVRYYVNNVEKAAGTYKTTTNVVIVAVAKSGYVLNITKPVIWIFTYTNKACPQPCHGLVSLRFIGNHELNNDVDCIPVVVTTGNPSSSDVCGTDNDKFTIPSTIGVVYKVNGVVAAAGTYNAPGTVIVTAHAADSGYVIANGQVSSWTFEFTNQTCPAADITIVAECSAEGILVTLNNSGDADGFVYINGTQVDVAINETKEIVVPTVLFKASVKILSDDSQTVLLNQAFDCTPGRGGAGGELSTPTTLVKPTSHLTTSSTPSELPSTGTGSTLLFVGMILAAITYGATYYLQGRRQLSVNE